MATIKIMVSTPLDYPDAGLRSQVFVSAQELYGLSRFRAAPVVLDVRNQNGVPDGRPEYQRGHVPGAVYVDLARELCGVSDARGGGCPLPPIADFQDCARSWGINNGDAVVVYDNVFGTKAGRAWFLLRWAGVTDVRLLDGGYAAWVSAGYPVSTGEPVRQLGDVALTEGHLPVIDAQGAAALGETGALLDARGYEQYAVNGHIPGAVAARRAKTLTVMVFFCPRPSSDSGSRHWVSTAPSRSVCTAGAGSLPRTSLPCWPAWAGPSASMWVRFLSGVPTLTDRLPPAADAKELPVPNDKPPAGDGRQLHLGYRHVPNGAHPAGWRYPGADRSRGFDPDYVVAVARTAQRAKFDFFLLEDSLATGAQQPYTGASSTAALEAFTTAAYLATLTRGIGLAVTADSAYYEPFNLARLTASLDYVTHGRGAWNIVVGSDQRAAHNYSLREAADEFSLYGRAYEFVDLVRALWDSWEDDAYVRNKDTGEFVDGSKIHPVDHDGKIFKVRGPLNVARPPQGHPLTLHEGNSELARQFAAQHADIAIGGGPTIAESQAYSADLRRRAAELGRDPAEIFVLPVLTPIVGKTFEEARSLYDELNSWLVLDRGVAEGALEALSRHIAFDVTDRDLSSVVPLAASTSIGPAGVTLVSTASHRTGRAAGTDSGVAGCAQCAHCW